MTKVETRVTNNSGREVVLKQINAGTYVVIKRIGNGGSYIIKSESNTTYREYWAGSVEGTQAGTPIVTFSSDDCIGNKEIKIPNGGEVQMIPRDQEEGIWTKILGFFRG